MVALFGNCFGSFQTSGNVEAKREALMIDVIKGSVINRLSLRTRVGTLSIPGALLEGIVLIKGKLPTGRKTFRSKSVFMKKDVVLFSQRFSFRICRFFD